MNLKLTAVDQSPVQGLPSDVSPVAITVDLARACDRLGYHRYWLAEHHNSINFAGPCPEILIGHIASQTERIRVGSGGVMLTHYSPYKVAEQFSMLETLYPGRIDLGIGRAPGGDALASHALAYPAQPGLEDYAEQAWLLQNFLQRSLPEDHPYAGLGIMPGTPAIPQTWMLGSSGGSAGLAGEIGMKMCLALFISPDPAPPSVITEYKQAWTEAGHAGSPEASIAVAALCADSREEAEYLAAPAVYWKVKAFRQGIREVVKHPDEALQLKRALSPSDQAFFDAVLNSMILGDAKSCAEQIWQVADRYQCDEVGIVTVTHDYQHRLRSYERLAATLL
ncbi:LLM class flavin-dependent oxidoreductase [Marinobacterium sp. AK62]|uniref:LLM class flavin-dependent oxidoreductase n=1 Tax=Marinobacterium alkalitolerans TaxID=1542925 RepID=A0ABS3ZB60_9GAMM|nr:LLM class flavin-dependent oxidoreductase [Marinobacterium alkalitolerans]MBP0048936.1 LLM class flavin-dependent oxidoreductase [Marinobacterium alkalitolerans]